MNRPPEPRPVIPWRDILAFPLSGLSLRLFFLILGIILLLIWQLVLRADSLLADTRQQHLAHTARLLQHHLQNQPPAQQQNTLQTLALPATLPLRLTAADGTVLYQNRALHPPQYSVDIGDAATRLTLGSPPDISLRRIALPAALTAFLLLAVLAWWLARALRRISRYAEAMAAGQPTQRPEYSDIYLKRLAEAVTTLRRELNGKTQIEHYIHHLTHELKTPLTAIHAAAEILHDPLADDERRRFLHQIERHSAQMHSLINRLLELARLENRDTLARSEPIALAPLITTLCQTPPRPDLRYHLDLHPVTLCGDPLLIRQAVQNLLDNAAAFAHAHSTIRIRLTPHTLTVDNQGDPIPAYALPRLFERFYSLPRPATGQKSSGLGLAFVQHIMTLHGGRVSLHNTADGVQAALHFPPPQNTTQKPNL